MAGKRKLPLTGCVEQNLPEIRACLQQQTTAPLLDPPPWEPVTWSAIDRREPVVGSAMEAILQLAAMGYYLGCNRVPSCRRGGGRWGPLDQGETGS